jgi:hypothetical protein
VLINQRNKEEDRHYGNKYNTHSGIDGMVFTVIMRTVAHSISPLC